MIDNFSAMRPYLFIQARMGSSRLPGKVLSNLNNTPLLQILINRLHCLDLPICILTTDQEIDDSIENFCAKQGKIKCFRGDEHNVAKRFIDAATYLNSNYFFRLTGDNPFVSIELIRSIYKCSQHKKFDYLSFPKRATLEGTRPEYISLNALKNCYKENHRNNYFTEHVTPILYDIANTEGSLLLPRLDFRHCDSLISNSSVTIDTKNDHDSLRMFLNRLTQVMIRDLIDGRLDIETICYESSSLCSLLQKRKD